MEVLFEDNNLLAINKPNGLLVHHSYYARNIHEPSLMEILSEKYKDLYLVHRLDRKTSGVILLTKSKAVLPKFQEFFNNNGVKKTYYAVVRGFSPENGTIDSPVRVDETDIRKDAITHYKTLASIELDIPVHPYASSRYSLIKLLPETGRMHQLRIHMNKISHPIVGDYKHGDRFHNRNFEQNFNWHTMFLHAQKVEFKHPINDELITIEADFPDNWQQLFKRFNWKV